MNVISPAKTFIVKCPLCFSENSECLFKFGTVLFPINISMCDHCGFVFQNPRVSEQDWDDYYEMGIYDEIHRPRAVKNDTAISPVGMVTYNRIRNFITNLNDDPHSLTADFDKTLGNIKICEIGAGNGDVISCFKGADLFAIEPSQNCWESLKRNGVFVLGKSINSIRGDAPTAFHLILMRHVLEHVYYPHKLLSGILPRLSDEGIFYVAVPNVLCPGFLGNFTYPHISHFSKYCLAYLCESAGFEICKIQEETDEIWCIMKKIRMGREESSQDRKSLFDKNIEKTKHCFKAYKNVALLLKRSAMRIFSNTIPLALLVRVYARRCKAAGR